MSSASVTLRGTISPLKGGPCRVALQDNDGQQWPIAPKGAGIDLLEKVGFAVEVICTIISDEEQRILVRSYKELDDEAWL